MPKILYNVVIEQADDPESNIYEVMTPKELFVFWPWLKRWKDPIKSGEFYLSVVVYLTHYRIDPKE